MAHGIHHKKAFALDAIFRNPKLSRIVLEGRDSPIGSTKRVKAKAILDLMSKIHGEGEFDGAGGPGDPGDPNNDPNDPSLQQGGGNSMIFPSAPAMSDPVQSNFENELSTGVDYMARTLGIPQSMSQTTPSGVNSPTFTPSQNLFGGWQNPYVAAQYSPDTTNGASTVLSNLTPPTIGGTNPSSYTSSAPDNTSFNGGFATLLKSIGGQNATQQPVINSITAPTQSQSGTAVTQSGAQQQQTQTGGSAPVDTSQYSNLSGMPSYSGPSDVNSAINKNIGPAAFAYGAMNSPAEMARLFPGATDLPTSSSASKAFADIQAATRIKYNLDGLLDQKNQLLANGPVAIENMKDYIAGRDQYLNKVNDTINSYTTATKDMDLANPVTAKNAQNYMNYLYTLKGNQNKRYVDFLNSSIAVYQSDLQSASDSYNTAASLYQNDISNAANITKDQYDKYYTMLTDMYNNVSEAPMKQMQMQAYAEQLRAAQLANIKAAGDSSNNPINILAGQAKFAAVPGVMEKYTNTATGATEDRLTKQGHDIGSMLDMAAAQGSPDYDQSAYLALWKSQALNGGTSLSGIQQYESDLNKLKTYGGGKYASIVPVLQSNLDDQKYGVLTNVASKNPVAINTAMQSLGNFSRGSYMNPLNWGSFTPSVNTSNLNMSSSEWAKKNAPVDPTTGAVDPSTEAILATLHDNFSTLYNNALPAGKATAEKLVAQYAQSINDAATKDPGTFASLVMSGPGVTPSVGEKAPQQYSQDMSAVQMPSSLTGSQQSNGGFLNPANFYTNTRK